jgi:hypothetical protein
MSKSTRGILCQIAKMLGEANEVKIGMSKGMDSALLRKTFLYEDYASCYLSDVRE